MVCSMSPLQASEDTAMVFLALSVSGRLHLRPRQDPPEALSESMLNGMTACFHPTKVRQAYFTDIRILSLFDLPQADVRGSDHSE
jgi:hypothetical protein